MRPPTNVLVAYASAHGSTRGVADALGQRLRKAGLTVDVRPFEEAKQLDGYDAVVLGSAIHDGAWLPAAVSFVGRHASELSSRQVWLFSVSSLGETTSFFGPRVAGWMRRRRHDTAELVGLKRSSGARGHRHFAGVVQPAHWGTAGSWFLRALGGTHGDHRDWTDIDGWADAIARDLLR